MIHHKNGTRKYPQIKVAIFSGSDMTSSIFHGTHDSRVSAQL